MKNFEQEKIKEFEEKFGGFILQNNLRGYQPIITDLGIQDFLLKALHQARLNALEEVEKLITEEMLICHQENTPTSRLTSLAMKIKTLK